MRSLPSRVGCLIAGGGPAGAALAGILARRGHSVVLVAGPTRPAAPLETLLPAALEPLQRCGLADAVRAAAVPDRRRHGARWDDDELRLQAAGPPGFCLERPGFELALRRWSTDQGAIVVDARVVGPLPDGGAGAVRLRGDAGEATVAAEVLVLATGRTPLAATLPVQVRASGPGTAAFALTGPLGAAADGLAVVEAAPSGWCWWVGAPDGRGIAVIAVDEAELRRLGRARAVDAVLAAAHGPAAALRGARIIGAVRATPRLQTTPAPVLLLGDAAATLDPLASQGTEKALVGAEAAALAVHTALRQPALRALAFAHHASWERELWRAHRRTAAGFYARVQRFCAQPFWRARSVAEPLPAPLPARLVARADLQPATVLVRVGDGLEPAAGWMVPGGEPLARLGRVAIAPLLAAFEQPCAVEPALAAAGADPRLYVLGSATVRQAAADLWQRGFLLPA